MNELDYDKMCKIGFDILQDPEVKEHIGSIILKLKSTVMKMDEAEEKLINKIPIQPLEPLILEKIDLCVIGMSLSTLLCLFKKMEEEESKKPEVNPSIN